MSVNWYGVIAQRHWVRWLPKQYAAIGDPESFFTTLVEDVARQIDDLTDELVGEIRQSDSYLAHVGRLFAARAIAEELILPQRVLPEAELAADDDQHEKEDVKPECGGTASGRGPRPSVMGGGERRTARAQKRP
jgi:hypothetical protein